MLFGKTDRGVAGLNIFLGVISMIFLIGILVGLFAITGAKMMEATDDVTAIDAINDTTIAIADAPDWFPIIIVVGAVVVVILLIAIVIGAIRGAGFMGNSGGA